MRDDGGGVVVVIRVGAVVGVVDCRSGDVFSGRTRVGVEDHGAPLGGGGGVGGRSGGDLLGFNLEDAELRGVLVLFGFFAQRTFGEAGTGATRGDELARELDEVGGDLDGRLDGFEDRRLAEGDLFVEGEKLLRVGVSGEAVVSVFNRLAGGARGGGAAGAVSGSDRIAKPDLVGEPDGEIGGGEGWGQVEFGLGFEG